jgi:predicted amidohydrolase YtcJ
MLADRPLVLEERDGHMSVCNTKALELAGLTRDTPDPEHGRIVRGASGELTGELQESAASWSGNSCPIPVRRSCTGALLHLLDRAASYA